MNSIATALMMTALFSTPTMAAPPQAGDSAAIDHLHDFDFLVGSWRVHHRLLKQRLAGNHEWIEFDGTLRNWTTMEGQGNVDDTYIGKPGGAYRAVGLRGYDPKSRTWAIWWLDGRDPHVIGPPVVGNFENGVGAFEGDDTFDGKPIKARFIWSNITANSAHWEQAFSPDGGRTWEVNWRMDLTRAP